jgi:translocation and assembly module TamB
VKKLLNHLVTRHSWHAARGFAITCALLLAVAFVTTVSVDLGPALRSRAEQAGTDYLERPLTIGGLSVQLWRGRFIVEDLIIGGSDVASAPFLTADRIEVSMPWSTLFSQRVVFDVVEMTDWVMHVESFPGGVHTFPDFTLDGPGGEGAWTTTLQYVHAARGQFTYEDHATPWKTVARNLDVVVTRPTSQYRGQASFSEGTVAIRNFVPMQADLNTSFRIEDGQILLDRIDLVTDGTQSVLTGAVEIANWPEQIYQVQSLVNFSQMREIFFASSDEVLLTGEGDFTGTFQVFSGGHDLEGTFASAGPGVNGYQFGNMQGSLHWLPDRLDVTDVTATLYSGQTELDYHITGLGLSERPATATLDAKYVDVDLTALTEAAALRGLRLAGQADGQNLLSWLLGDWGTHQGNGEIRVTPPPGVSLLNRQIPVAVSEAPAQDGSVPFSAHAPREPVAVGGRLVYAYGSEWVEVAHSQLATADTYLEVEGRTAYGESSEFPFHVTSADWQESDRLLAAVMTVFGTSAQAVPIGGFGTFDGVMLDSLRRPRIEGTFDIERLRAFDVLWGHAEGEATIENLYADVQNVRIRSDDATLDVDGRFSIGYPRADAGEQINARIQMTRWPVVDLRHAFRLDAYDVTGVASGEYRVFGDYERPFGFGTMSILDGIAYGEAFDAFTASLRLEGEGARFDTIEVFKAGGRGAGAAFIGWDGTYSFNFDAERMQVDGITLAVASGLPLAGVVDFTAGGSGTFDVPRYDLRGTIRDFFIGDEGLGEVLGAVSVNGNLLTLNIEAASPRLAVSGAGRIALTSGREADLSFSVSDTSLDPYVRVFEPRFSPFTTVVASGNVRVTGSLADVDAIVVEAIVERVDMRFFDYAVRNDAPVRIAFDQHAVRIDEMRLVGDGTELDVSGLVDLHNAQIELRTTGLANLNILQGFASDVRGSGQARVAATFEGDLENPLVNGTMAFDNGRVRYFGLPHAVENLSGEARFDSRGLNLDGLTGRLGGGAVAFGGRIELAGYLPSRLDIRMTGEQMRLRFPEGMRSLVDATLTLQGTPEAPTLTGEVTVRSGIYTRRFDAIGDLLSLADSDVLDEVATVETTIPLRYDVRISAPSTLVMENNVVRIEASADLQLRGTYDRPLLVGRAEIDSGELGFEGRRYTITRGTVDFTNPIRIEPFFDIETETRVRVPGQTYRITVRGTGTFDRLTTEVSSDPPLPEVETLSLLLSDVVPGQDVEFRRYTAAVTPEQQLLRERATRALTGTLSSEVGRVIEETLGVDTFQFSPSLVDPNEQSSRLDPAARVTIGKRLSDRIFLTYSRSLSSSRSDQLVLLEYDQTDRFSWVLSRNEDRTYALEVRRRHAF